MEWSDYINCMSYSPSEPPGGLVTYLETYVLWERIDVSWKCDALPYGEVRK